MPIVAPALARHVVRNGRALAVDWNTCGQASIATVLAHFRRGPFATAGIDDGAAIDFVRARFGPDVPFGLGTTAHRIAAALRAHGLGVEISHSGWFGTERDRALSRLLSHLTQGIPTPVCLDLGMLGGTAWSAHWAVALRFDRGIVELGNMGADSLLGVDAFMAAWRCRHLPLGHNHCAVLATWSPAFGS